jgi:hypothetical protein
MGVPPPLSFFHRLQADIRPVSGENGDSGSIASFGYDTASIETGPNFDTAVALPQGSEVSLTLRCSVVLGPCFDILPNLLYIRGFLTPSPIQPIVPY